MLAHVKRQRRRHQPPDPGRDTIYRLEMGSGRTGSGHQGGPEGLGGEHSGQPSGGMRREGGQAEKSNAAAEGQRGQREGEQEGGSQRRGHTGSAVQGRGAGHEKGGKGTVDSCGCHASKQSDSRDRGLVSGLPIPYCAHSLLYVDFIHGLPKLSGYDSCLVLTCGLTRFTRAFPCTKMITGEQTVQILVEHLRRCTLTKTYVSEVTPDGASEYWTP